MSKQIRFGGVSTPMGITFQGEKYGVNWSREGSSVYKLGVSRSNSFVRLLRKIPFVRGLFMLSLIIFEMFYSIYWKKKSNLLILIVALVGVNFLINLVPFGTETEVVISAGFNIFAIVLVLVIFLVFGYFIYKSRGNHSIEHKVIGAYDRTGDVKIDDVINEPCEHPRCGGNLVAWFFLVDFIVFLVLPPFNEWLKFLLIIAIGYELGLMACWKGWFGKLMFVPGWLIQKLTTTNNVNVDDLKSARKAFLKLLDYERGGKL